VGVPTTTGLGAWRSRTRRTPRRPRRGTGRLPQGGGVGAGVVGDDRGSRESEWQTEPEQQADRKCSCPSATAPFSAKSTANAPMNSTRPVAPPRSLPAAAGAPSSAFGSRSGGPAQAPGCVPVPDAVCGSVRVPLFRSKPAGRTIDIAYVLIHHRDPAVPAARGTVVINPGGPGNDVIGAAADWTERLAGLVADHDLLLIDPRGTGQSHPLTCGITGLPATRRGLVRAIADCRRALGRQARAYTSAATADDFEAVRAHLASPSSTSSACPTAPT
jgi:alpha/beta hydrolase fold